MSVRLFKTPYQEFIYKSRYARWVEKKGRREDLPETINRYLNFMEDHLKETCGYDLPINLRMRLYSAMSKMEALPSMRALMTAGEALARDNTAGFNCSFLPVDHARSFDETMFILLCGTGVGFSVERIFVNKLPMVPFELVHTTDMIIVGDSKEGWAQAYQELLAHLFGGRIPRYDTSLVRPAGARLKTFGGRASGPGPLIELFEFTIAIFVKARGRRLRTLECHDIQCKIGDIVVVGGVRRSAMISLSDVDDHALAQAKGWFVVSSYEQLDERTYMVHLINPYYETESHKIYFKPGDHDWDLEQMLTKKCIPWYLPYPYRQLSNNSAVYNEKPSRELFETEWAAMIASGSGERGLFSRAAAVKQVKKNGRRDPNHIFGTNPCAEIILRPYQMCNLSTNVIRAEDSLDDILAKITTSTIMGTFQSTLTHFPYLRDVWKTNTEEERLLGVSLTGVMDHSVLNGSMGEDMRDAWLIVMNEQAVAVNKELAAELGIQQSVAVTCIKPEGTVSQLTDSASGIHTRHSPFYVRTVRQDNKDPMTAFMKSVGIPNEPCLSKPEKTTIFSFPMMAPLGAITRNDLTAIEQLENWLAYQRYYCEHKPSCTVSVGEAEWAEVADWVYENFDELSGVSFLPRVEHIYKQAPYQDIDEDTYIRLVNEMPEGIDWAGLVEFEREDATTNSQTLACTAGACEI